MRGAQTSRRKKQQAMRGHNDIGQDFRYCGRAVCELILLSRRRRLVSVGTMGTFDIALPLSMS